MRTLTILVALIIVIGATSCTSKTQIEVMKDQYTPVLVLNDSIQAVNFNTVPYNDKDAQSVITLQFTLNGETKVATSSSYKTAYAIPADTAKHDVVIGYFIQKKDIR